MDHTKESPVVLSLCTGMRGLERGIERVIGRLTVAAYVEIETFICYNLVTQMEAGLLDPAPIWTNLKTFPARQFHGKIHILTGGYPCQPFSLAGKLQGVNDERHLYPYIEQIIGCVKPPVIFFENVANHLNLGYREVKQSLEAMDYAVKEGIFTAQEVGAPHRRERLFILALANTNSSSAVRRFANFLQPTDQDEGEAQGEDGKRSGNVIADGDKTMADSGSEGLEGRIEQSTWKECQAAERSGEVIPNSLCLDGSEIQIKDLQQSIIKPKSFSDGSSWRINRFPAGQGYYQHSWEEPRTVKSGMGSTINGYNFRHDLLRMYGNGVVEQTAELAFITLLNEHLNSNHE